ncbi:MAG: hypothetical protein UV63_C0036G0003 [Microgenomates group bacterium GW2011_GWC1_43_11]|nr:MAG: hypothetical protein UV63_C0036G0003 [Microgenomates group bacterium GW2011_GWC1_43_11]
MKFCFIYVVSRFNVKCGYLGKICNASLVQRMSGFFRKEKNVMCNRRDSVFLRDEKRFE